MIRPVKNAELIKIVRFNYIKHTFDTDRIESLQIPAKRRIFQGYSYIFRGFTMSVALKDLANSTFAKLALAAAVSFGVAANANAESGEKRCLPTAQMKAELNAKGQVGLIAFEQQGS
ncbi:MAG: hypothetical protein WAT68_11520, partial [Candidatus Nitrotoga sp.]